MEAAYVAMLVLSCIGICATSGYVLYKLFTSD